MENSTSEKTQIVLDTFRSDLNLDCVSFCSITGFENLLLVAKYEQDQKDFTHSGGLILFDTKNKKLEKIIETTAQAIFDLIWIPKLISNKLCFLVALAEPKIELYHYAEGRILKLWDYSLTLESKILYLDTLCIQEDLYILIVDDKMKVTRIKVDEKPVENSKVIIDEDYKYTVWCANFMGFNPNSIILGGDDCIMSIFDINEDNSANNRLNDKRTHEMGITCFNFNKIDENYFVSGSYDEHIRLWDKRKLAPKGSSIHELKLGGGVWRAKHHDTKPIIVCACMHENFQIVEYQQFESLKPILSYKEHKSLAYGVDWKRDNQFTIASCSFYDKYLSLWDAGL